MLQKRTKVKEQMLIPEIWFSFSNSVKFRCSFDLLWFESLQKGNKILKKISSSVCLFLRSQTLAIYIWNSSQYSFHLFNLNWHFLRVSESGYKIELTKINVCFFSGSRAEKIAILLKSIIPEHPLMAKCTNGSVSLGKVKKCFKSSI